jgi:hypothetical protein
VYRPQFPYITPKGCTDQRCTYSFDFTNTPFLNAVIPSLSSIDRIPLPLDKDADFYLRGISTLSQPQGTAELMFRLEDPSGHPLNDTDNVLQTTNYVFPSLYSQTDGAGIVALDSDDWGIYCQAGSRLYLWLWNNGGASFDLTLACFNLHGVKRYLGGCR